MERTSPRCAQKSKSAQQTKKDGYFEVQTPAATYQATNVILAIGRVGNPRHLTIPGAELGHVAYRLKDPRAYTDKDILVVGEVTVLPKLPWPCQNGTASPSSIVARVFIA
jgi:cation diffusion facilitator CzcD-associated flavoprotein CzcO